MNRNLVGSIYGRFIWLSSLRGEDFFKSANQKQELSVAAMFVNGSGRNELVLFRLFLTFSKVQK
jgi:hypothetical protein